ncbi:MAG: adenylate/guanylate cyclase domain-containing protein [Rhodothermales bacterium]
MPYKRTTLAIVFADISKSTQLFEAYGNERAREIVARALAILSTVTTSHEGRVIKTIGDEVMCTFEHIEQAVGATTRMPQAITEDPELAEIGMALRIGLHFGDVLSDEYDVYGDAVNVAARMVQLARPDQIITTRTTVDLLPNYQHSNLRGLGVAHVRGKKSEMEIYEVLWQPDMTDLTIMHGQLPLGGRTPKARLYLRYAEQDYKLEKGRFPFLMGRGEKNDLVVPHQSVSRTHASIEYQGGKFILIDRSTNGTFLQIRNEEKVFLHREQIHLRNEGVIMLGQDMEEEGGEAIHFQCTE